jgi:L-alanine-DL-glutamate epimerase-like enolase superfamily enzyme
VKISNVELFPITVPLTQPIGHAFGTRKEGRFVVIKIGTDEGFEGIGCGSVLYNGYIMDCQESVMAKLIDLSKNVLLGSNPLHTGMILDKVDKAMRGNSITKAHVDYALHDLKGKILDVPVYDLLGGLVRETMQTEWIVTLDTPEKQAESAQKYLAAGFVSLKLKPGVELNMAVKRFRAVREAVGSEVEIAIDLDGVLNAHDSLRLIKALEPYNLHYAEQPVTKHDLRGFVHVRSKTDVPIVADESAWSVEELVALINANACDMCHLSLDRIGGFRKALQFRNLLDAFNMDYAMCTYNSPGLNHAALTHFACTCNKRGPIVDELATILMYTGGTGTEQIVNPDITREINAPIIGGIVQTPKGPGLGVELNQELVQKYLTVGLSSVTVKV